MRDTKSSGFLPSSFRIVRLNSAILPHHGTVASLKNSGPLHFLSALSSSSCDAAAAAVEWKRMKGGKRQHDGWINHDFDRLLGKIPTGPTDREATETPTIGLLHTNPNCVGTVTKGDESHHFFFFFSFGNFHFRK